MLRIKSNTIVGDKLAEELGRTLGPKAWGAQNIWGMNLYFAHKKIGSSGDLVRDFGAESELAAHEQDTVPVVCKVSKASC